MALFLFTKNIIEGKPINVFNHGKMRRDFTYIDDIVEGVVRVLKNTGELLIKDWDGDQSRSLLQPCSLPDIQHRQ